MKNIKNIPEEKMYKSSREERLKAKFADDYYDDRDYTSWKPINNWVRRFIQKHVGKSYNKTYSEFLSIAKKNKNIPNVIDGYSIERTFKRFFKGYYPDFKVVNGIIQQIKFESRHQRPKYYYEYPNGHKYRYTLSEKYKNDSRFVNLIINSYGYKMYERMTSLISANEVESIQKFLRYGNYIGKFNEIYGWYTSSTNIWDEIDLAKKVKREYTKSMRKRDNAEKRDAESKIMRDRLVEREKQISELLHSLEEEKKRIEKEKNEIDIERHGFDKDESFKGEFYHGQKRKKK